MQIYTTKNVCVAVSTVSSAASNAFDKSALDNNFGRNSSRVVPVSIGKPFYELLKNEPSTTVTTILSFLLPVDTARGFSNPS